VSPVRNSGTIPGTDEPPELQYNGHWRMAVWALRVGYVGLAVAIAGVILRLLGSTSWVLAVGVINLARRRSRHVGGGLLVPARASRPTTWVLVDAIHAHQRHSPPPIVGPAVLTAPPFAGASSVRQLSLLLARPGVPARAIRPRPVLFAGSMA
jgi:hypothetical protein